MPVFLFGFILGAIGASFAETRIPIAYLLAVFLGLVLGFCVWRAQRAIHRSIMLLSGLIIGFALSSWQIYKQVDVQLAPEFDGLDYSIQFVIDSIPSNKNQSSIFTARVLKLDCADECPNLEGHRVRLGWYRQAPELYGGDIWQARVRLKRPRGFVNPGGFDYQAWLLGQNVVATGYIRESAQRLEQTHNLARLRQVLNQHLLGELELKNKGFFSALLVGDKSKLRPEDWQVLQATGTVHLMAISGLHIGLMAFLGLFLGRLIVRFLAIVCPLNVYYVHALPLILALVLALVYAAMAGFSLPTSRAASACTLLSLTALCGIRMAPWTWYLWVLSLVMILEPLAAFSAGFWLSFGAVAVLIYCFYGRKMALLKALFVTQIVLTIGLSVPLLIAGQALSLSSPLANFIAVPLVSFVIVPGLMLAACLSVFSDSLATPVLVLLDGVFQCLWWCLSLLNASQLNTGFDRPLNLLAVIALVLACALFLAPRGLPLRMPAAFLFVLVIFAYQPELPELQVTAMDVGQGLAVVIKTPRETWLYDTGPAFSDEFDAGSRIILPYLRQQGVRKLSLVVSHGDLDHSGGTEGLSSQMAIERFIVGEALPGQQYQFCQRGDSWSRGSLTIEVLWPDKPGAYEGNNASCVLLLTLVLESGRRQILLTGDIDKGVERKLLADIHQPVDLLVASHHGSNSSSAWSFVRRSAPKAVVFSAGYKNRYHHPSEKVVSRFVEIDAKIFNTAEDGAIVFKWYKNGEYGAERSRVQAFRLWYDR